MWHALDITLTARAREAAEYALMEAGAAGTEFVGEEGGGRARVSAYFDAPPEIERVRAALLEALRIYGLESSDVREMSPREVEDADWLAEWKKDWRATRAGERFVVAPPWSEVEDEGGSLVIRVEPGMAFGTGTHETTRLCLTAIEKHFRGESFLDVGTGTGVLAIAAAKLRPAARVEACDTDPLAVEVARENAALNGVAAAIEFRVGSVGEGTAPADTVCANLTADVILPLLPPLVAAARRTLILSGILDVQRDAVLARLGELGVEECEVTREGEWVAVAAVVAAAAGSPAGGPRVHLVFLRSGAALVTKRLYADWREIQDEHEDFLTSLGPWTEGELLAFLRGEYGEDEAAWGFTRGRIRAFMDSPDEVLRAG